MGKLKLLFILNLRIEYFKVTRWKNDLKLFHLKYYIFMSPMLFCTENREFEGRDWSDDPIKSQDFHQNEPEKGGNGLDIGFKNFLERFFC